MRSAADHLAELSRICESIDKEWSIEDYKVDAFPQIAFDAASGFDFAPFGELGYLRGCLDLEQIQHLQDDSTFSDLYVRLFDNGRMWVEVLNWWGSDITLHDHDFSGIQVQLKGRSVNTVYDFSESLELSDLRFGGFTIKRVENWEPGSRSIVLPGRVERHNVCHLDVPTVSLLIRTAPYKHIGRQWNYFPPVLAASYDVASNTFRKNVKALRLVATRQEVSEFVALFDDFCTVASPRELLFAVIKMIDVLFEERYAEFLARFARHPYGEAIILAASFYYFSEAMKGLQRSQQYAWEDSEQKALASLSASWDHETFKRIYQCAIGNSDAASTALVIEAIRNKLKGQDAKIYANALSAYGIGKLESKAVA